MNKQIKQENRKAFPKFLIMMILAVLLGILMSSIGFAVRRYGVSEFITIMQKVLNVSAIWIIPVSFLVISVPCGAVLLQCGKSIKSWDNEDEELFDRVQQKLNYVILFSNVCYFLNLLVMSCALFTLENFGHIIAVLIEFLISMGIMLFQQKKSVDMLKVLNPEKHGSVFDLNFQKEWVNSCDEAEQKRIGEASYSAFQAVNITCGILWIVITFLNTIFTVGIIPYIILTIILTASNAAYCLTEIRANKRSDTKL